MSKRNRGNRQEFEASSVILWTGLLLTSKPSGLTTVMACSLGCADAFVHRQRGGKPSGRRQSAWSSQSAARSVGDSHSRAYTNVYHDRCRAEVAVAKHRHPLSSCLWVACSSAGGQVARRLPGRHSSVAASRCAAGLDFLWGAVPREDRHLGALKVVFCPKAQAGNFGRLVGTATPLRGHRRPGACSRLNSPIPGPCGSLWEQGSHLPYTPTGRLR